MESIGLLGLGIMGRGMAIRLAKCGYQVTVWNRTRGKAEELVQFGAKVADTPRQAAEGNDIVITMLADPKAVKEVDYGPDGVLAGLKAGAVLIDCSTVDPATSRKLASRAGEAGADFLDCPVGGSKVAAENGELVLMVAGDPAVVARVRPVLEKMSKKITYAGETGMGASLKLCFNLIVSHMAAGLSESLMLGARSGLDPALVLDAVNGAVIGSKFYEWKGACILDRDFSTNFSLKLMHKDLNLMMETAYDLNTPLPVTASVKELFGMAAACCDPEADFSSVIRALETVTGTEVRRSDR